MNNLNINDVISFRRLSLIDDKIVVLVLALVENKFNKLLIYY